MEMDLIQKLNELFDHMAEKTFNLHMMDSIVALADGTAQDVQVPMDLFKKAANCLVIAKQEVDYRVFRYYIPVFKRVFLRTVDQNEAMQCIYDLDHFKTSADKIPALRDQYSASDFDKESNSIVKELLDPAADEERFERTCREFAFYLTIAPKPVVNAMMQCALYASSDEVLDIAVKVFRRMPAFFTLRVQHVYVKEKQELVCIALFRHLICTQFRGQARKMASIKYLATEMTCAHLEMEGDEESRALPPVFDPNELIDDLVVDLIERMKDSSTTVLLDMLLGMLGRSEGQNKLWDINWKPEEPKAEERPGHRTIDPQRLQNAIYDLYKRDTALKPPLKNILMAYELLYNRLKSDAYPLTDFQEKVFADFIKQHKDMERAEREKRERIERERAEQEERERAVREEEERLKQEAVEQLHEEKERLRREHMETQQKTKERLGLEYEEKRRKFEADLQQKHEQKLQEDKLKMERELGEKHREEQAKLRAELDAKNQAEQEQIRQEKQAAKREKAPRKLTSATESPGTAAKQPKKKASTSAKLTKMARRASEEKTDEKFAQDEGTAAGTRADSQAANQQVGDESEQTAGEDTPAATPDIPEREPQPQHEPEKLVDEAKEEEAAAPVQLDDHAMKKAQPEKAGDEQLMKPKEDGDEPGELKKVDLGGGDEHLGGDGLELRPESKMHGWDGDDLGWGSKENVPLAVKEGGEDSLSAKDSTVSVKSDLNPNAPPFNPSVPPPIAAATAAATSHQAPFPLSPENQLPLGTHQSSFGRVPRQVRPSIGRSTTPTPSSDFQQGEEGRGGEQRRGRGGGGQPQRIYNNRSGYHSTEREGRQRRYEQPPRYTPNPYGQLLQQPFTGAMQPLQERPHSLFVSSSRGGAYGAVGSGPGVGRRQFHDREGEARHPYRNTRDHFGTSGGGGVGGGTGGTEQRHQYRERDRERPQQRYQMDRSAEGSMGGGGRWTNRNINRSAGIDDGGSASGGTAAGGNKAEE